MTVMRYWCLENMFMESIYLLLIVLEVHAFGRSGIRFAQTVNIKLQLLIH